MTHTHTYVTMEVSAKAYDEIKQKLLDAGYDHAITGQGREKDVIDMHGIALQREAPPKSNGFGTDD